MFHLKMIEYRKKNMMTQEELADRLGVSRQTITKWEKGTILPSLEYLIYLSRLFGVTIDHLVKDDDCICESSHQVHTTALAEFLVLPSNQPMRRRKIKQKGQDKAPMTICFPEIHIHTEIHSLALPVFPVRSWFTGMLRPAGV